MKTKILALFALSQLTSLAAMAANDVIIPKNTQLYCESNAGHPAIRFAVTFNSNVPAANGRILATLLPEYNSKPAGVVYFNQNTGELHLYDKGDAKHDFIFRQKLVVNINNVSQATIVRFSNHPKAGYPGQPVSVRCYLRYPNQSLRNL